MRRNDEGGVAVNSDTFRQTVVNTLKRRLFYIPSFQIYGGVAGLYYYGPPGCGVKSNVLAFWRQHFVLEENMLEVDCPCVTSEIVLKASGHVDKFTDLVNRSEIADLPQRKSIPPRQGLLRVREFTLTEIEHFVDPQDKSHLKFSEVANLEFLMFPRGDQFSGLSARKICLGEAVSMGIVNNETLGYFIGRAYLFLTCLGIDKERLRFRQHLAIEMAHYAADCWDAEIECSYGWIACVGIVVRSVFDLQAHSDKCRVQLVAHEKHAKSKEVEAMCEKEAMEMKANLESKGEAEFRISTLGKDVKINKKMVTITKEKKKENQRIFTPSVIEPSFGIGRIIYCLYEHSFYTRPSKTGDEQLNVFGFLPLVAPIKCSVFPLVQNIKYEQVVKRIVKSLTAAGISNKSDMTSKTIGKRYVISDELGIPFAVTADLSSSVTIRERDSRVQFRVSVGEVANIMKEVIEGRSTWPDMLSKYHHSTSISEDE